MTIKTWRERLFAAEPIWLSYPADGGAVWEAGNAYKEDEIADLREALESVEALLSTLQSEIMNIPAKRSDLEFEHGGARLLYKEGHRDARHAAVEVVMEFARRLESGAP